MSETATVLGPRVSYFDNGRQISGKIIHTITSGVALTDEQLLTWANLKPGSRLYQSVKGPANVERVVIEKDNGFFVITPVWRIERAMNNE